MNSANPPYSPFKSKRLQGQVYDMEHLAPFTIDVLNGDEAIKVEVRFSCHCFTEKFDPAAHKPDLQYHYDGEVRAFSIARHGLSQALPDLVKSLAGKSVYFANQGNFFYLRFAGQEAPYVVFFYVAKLDRKAAKVLMMVQSAYLKTDMTNAASPVRFVTLISKTAKGEKVKPGPYQRIKRK